MNFPGVGRGVMLRIILCGLVFLVPATVSAGKLDIYTIYEPAYTAPGQAYYVPEPKALWTPGSGIYFRGEPWEIQVAGRSANTALAIAGLTQSNSTADSIGFSVIAIANILSLLPLIFDDSAQYPRSDWDFFWEQLGETSRAGSAGD